MKKFLIINGPNLNLLGSREPEVYGGMSLDEIEKYTQSRLGNRNVRIDWFQSNIEGEIINKIQEVVSKNYNALIINPGGYSHTSVAIYDALKIIKCPIVEVHLTNTAAREDFRQQKITGKAASIIIEGAGRDVYYLAICSQLFDGDR